MEEELIKRLSEVERNVEMTNEFLNSKSLRNDSRIKNQKIAIICITIVAILSLIVNCLMFYHVSKNVGYTEENTYREEYNIDQDTNDGGTINNVDGNQYNDSATHNEQGND